MTCFLSLLLQELPWRRIDVSFQGARFGFAHNNIQVGQQQVLSSCRTCLSCQMLHAQ
jgi:hypothetical protein